MGEHEMRPWHLGPIEWSWVIQYLLQRRLLDPEQHMRRCKRVVGYRSCLRESSAGLLVRDGPATHLCHFTHGEYSPLAGLHQNPHALLLNELVDRLWRERASSLPNPSWVFTTNSNSESVRC